jgi:hypothetical protein
MRKRLIIDSARALVAVATLAVLLVGVPFGLAVFVGWPLPHGLPSLSEVWSALGSQSISDEVLVKTVAVVCWLAWAQLMLCAGAELAAWKKGEAAHRVRFAGALQPVMAQLVMSAAVLFHSMARTPAPAPPTLRAMPAVQLVSVPAVVPELPSHPADLELINKSVAAPDPRHEPKSYVVKARDDLWSLAEAHLGDPYRWKELFALNQGRTQPDGRTLQRANLVRPGWILHFPDDATGLPHAASSASPAPAPAGPVVAASPAQNPAAPPETSCAPDLSSAQFPSAVAAEPVMEPTPHSSPSTAPIVEPPPASSLSTTPVVEPVPPSSPSTAPIVQPPPSSSPSTAPVVDPVPPNSPSPPSPSAPVGPAEPSTHEQRPGPVVPLGLAGAGLLAAGVVATLDRLRRVQQRRRPAGHTVRTPSAEVAPTELTLRRAATSSPAGRLDLALRAFAHCAAQRQGGNAPSVEAVRIADDGVEILLTERLDAPGGPFSVVAGGQAWTLAPVDEKAAEPLAVQMVAPIPALVTVGRADDADVLVDLEAAGCTAITGEPDAAKALFRSIVLELATSTWSDCVDVVLVGIDAAAYETLERTTVVDSLADALPDLEGRAAATSDELANRGEVSTLAARLRHGGDGWVPTVVLCANPSADEDALAHLVGLAGDGSRGLAVVALGDAPGAGRTVRIQSGLVEISPPGITVTATAPTPEEMADLEEILAVATDQEGVELDGPEMTHEAPVATIHPAPRSGDDLPDHEVIVRLLGPVEVEGGRTSIDRRKAVELVAYLATHRQGVDDARLKTVLWLDERAPQASFNTTVTRARSSLGLSADGTHHLPHLADSDRRYRLGPGVDTDAAVLERRLAVARKQPAAAAIETLIPAVELVRGMPFEGVRSGYEWAHADGLVARMEAVVADAAHLLAQLALEVRDPVRADWAARQGLLTSPANEVLFRDRMFAADMAGNPAGVEAVMDELCAVTEALEPYDSLHPETIALYERLSHRKRRTG